MTKNEIISPYFDNGVFAGVRVTFGDEDFVIAPKDFQNGKEMPWQEAMDTLKAVSLDTFNYRQICFTMAYIKAINKMLRDNGGDALDKYYWTCEDCLDKYSFHYYGIDGRLTIDAKYNANRVRPIKNLKK